MAVRWQRVVAHGGRLSGCFARAGRELHSDPGFGRPACPLPRRAQQPMAWRVTSSLANSTFSGDLLFIALQCYL